MRASDTVVRTLTISVVGSMVAAAIIWLLFTTGLLLKGGAWAWHAFSWSWENLLASYSIPGWAILLALLLVLPCLVLVKNRLGNTIRSSPSAPGASYLNYTEDIVDGVKWRWKWNVTRGIAEVSDLWCFCNHCDAQLRFFNDSYRDPRSTHLICERCPANGVLSDRSVLVLREGRGRVVSTVPGDDSEVRDATLREVLRRVRTQEYPKG